MLIGLNERLERKHASPVPKPEHRKMLIVRGLRLGWLAAYRKMKDNTEFGSITNFPRGTNWQVIL
jgi:hypothetical protein